jgi:hypothetical protein
VWFPSEVLKTDEEEPKAMADKVSMALAELVRRAEADGDVDFLREGVRVLSPALMELEVAQHLGAERVRHVGAQTIPFAKRRGSEYFTSGSAAYPRAKARRERSMPSKREALEDAESADLRDLPSLPDPHTLCSTDPRNRRGGGWFYAATAVS